MNRFLATICGLAISAGALSQSQIAHAAAATPSDCAKINFAGTYKTGQDLYGDQHTVDVKQDHCLLTVTESWTNPSKSSKPESHVWKLDLSGRTEFQVPGEVIDLQGEGNDFGKQTLESLHGTATLDMTPDNAMNVLGIKVKMKMHIPTSQYSSMASDILMTGKIVIAFYGMKNVGAPDYIYFETGKIRLESVDSPWYVGVFKNCFVNGANYVLRFLDGGNYIGLTIPQFQRFYRAQ